jgi:hypothetical protein
MGNITGVGDTIRFAIMFCNSTYSSNEKLIVLSLNPLLESGGLALISNGGNNIGAAG